MERLSVGEALRAGWDTFRARPLFFILATLVVGVVSAISSSIVQNVQDTAGFGAVLLVSLLDFALQSFIYIGLYRIALRAVDAPGSLSARDAWAPRYFPSFAVASILYSILIVAGLIALIVPGLILASVFFFTFYPIVERGAGPLEAFSISRRITRGSRMQVFLLILAITLINILGALVLGVGLLVSLPVGAIASAYAYRRLEPSPSFSTEESSAQ